VEDCPTGIKKDVIVRVIFDIIGNINILHFEVDFLEINFLEVDFLEVDILEVDISEVDFLEVDIETQRFSSTFGLLIIKFTLYSNSESLLQVWNVVTRVPGAYLP
jgi:hypothetical protein